MKPDKIYHLNIAMLGKFFSERTDRN